MRAQLYDTHAHYNNHRFDEEFEGGTDALLTRLFDGDLYAINNIGWDIDSSRAALDMSLKYDRLYFAAGIHPCDTYKYTDMDSALAELEQIISDGKKCNKLVALGEIGYDFHYEDTDRECQMRWFDAQMSLAAKHRIPVVIHDRDAHGDTMEIIRKYPSVTGIFHSFSGSPEMAEERVKRGYYISFSGVLTFKNAAKLPEVARIVPTDRMLIETDCPYLAPHPHRGKRNDSILMRHTAEKLAEIKGMTYEEVCEITFENAKRVYRIGI